MRSLRGTEGQGVVANLINGDAIAGTVAKSAKDELTLVGAVLHQAASAEESPAELNGRVIIASSRISFVQLLD